MSDQVVRLSVPAEPSFARTVRMMAASLAVVCEMSVDEVEDVRMAAEEGFVLCCGTAPESCEVSFTIGAGEVRTSFGLGSAPLPSGDAYDLAELLLQAVCDEHGVTDDGSTLCLVNRAGGAHA